MSRILGIMMLWSRAARAFSPVRLRSFPSARNLSTTSNIVTERMREESESAFARLIDYYEDKAYAPRLLDSPVAASDFLQHIDTVLFDCDGVLYRSPDAAPGAAACLSHLLRQNKRIFFVTNNSAANPAQLRTKLTQLLGLEDHVLTQDMMISTAFTAAHYCRQQFGHKGAGRLYVIGSEGLREELRRAGLQALGGDESKASMTRDELANYDFTDKPVDAVVVGHDTDFGFRQLCIANVLLQRNPDAQLVATNLDAFDLVGADGHYLPGNGSLVAAVAYASGRTAVDCGKPSRLLAELLQDLYGLDPSRSLFVGDRLDTDVRFGANTGMSTALVLTGVTTAAQLQALGEGTEEEPLPTHLLPHVGYLAGEV